MSALSIESRIVLALALSGSMAACSGSGDGSRQTQPTNLAGAAGFVNFGTGSFAGFVGSGGTPFGGYPPNNTGGVVLTGEGGIIVGQAGFSPGGGAGGVPPGAGGLPPGNGGFPVGGTPVDTGGAPPGAGGGIIEPPVGGCGQALPAVTDYTQDGPFGPATVVNNSGPDGQYTMFKPANIGQNGFLHPPTTWGNGITTMPNYYDGLLRTIASHGFVVIASNSTNVTAQLMTQGLDWLVQQNNAAGDLQGHLDTKCLLTIGYSLGGGAAVTAGSHADVVATVSMHGVQGSSGSLHAPLLLFTSETDTFVTASGFVTPTYNASSVQTFYATLSAAGDPSNKGHLIPIGFGDPERAPMVAWMRLWAYGDAGARQFFYGDQCTLCAAPWTNPQRKNWQ